MIKLTTLISSNNGLMENSRLSRFSTKGQLACKNRLKRSFLKSQFQNPRNLGEKDFFTRFTQKQLPIHSGTKNRLNTLSHPLLGGSVPTKYYVKIKMM